MKFFPPRPETAVRGPGGMGSAKPGDTAVVVALILGIIVFLVFKGRN